MSAMINKKFIYLNVLISEYSLTNLQKSSNISVLNFLFVKTILKSPLMFPVQKKRKKLAIDCAMTFVERSVQSLNSVIKRSDSGQR